MSIIELLRDTLEYCISEYQLPNIVLKFGKRGQTRQDNQLQWLITIRAFWYQAEELVVASLLHEIAHIIQCTQHAYTHNKQFRDIERTLLADFGLCPIGYNKRASYYTTLQTISGGHHWDRRVAWNQTGIIEGAFSILK